MRLDYAGSLQRPGGNPGSTANVPSAERELLTQLGSDESQSGNDVTEMKALREKLDAMELTAAAMLRGRGSGWPLSVGRWTRGGIGGNPSFGVVG
jgi:hypothetical protein